MLVDDEGVFRRRDAVDLVLWDLDDVSVVVMVRVRVN